MSKAANQFASHAPGSMPPLPYEFLTMPLPPSSEFRTDAYGDPASGSLGEAIRLTAQVADAFGASDRTIYRIYRLTNQMQDYLPYAPIAGAILEDAYRGTQTVQPGHLSPFLQANHPRLPWRARQNMERVGLTLGSEAPATFVMGGLHAVLSGSAQAREALTAYVGPKLAVARPYVERYASFEPGPRGEFQREANTLLDYIAHGARYFAGQRRTQEGQHLNQAKIAKNPDHYVDHAAVGESVKQTTLAVLRGQIQLPMVRQLIQDGLGLTGKDMAFVIGKIDTLDPRAFPVAAHRIIKTLNAALPPEHQHRKLQELASDGGSGLRALASMYPGKAGKIFRALGKLPTIVSTAVRHMPAANSQLTYPLEVMTALTDPNRPTIALARRAGRVATAAA